MAKGVYLMLKFLTARCTPFIVNKFEFPDLIFKYNYNSSWVEKMKKWPIFTNNIYMPLSGACVVLLNMMYFIYIYLVHVYLI